MLSNKLSVIRRILISKLTHTPYKFNVMVTGACNSRCVMCRVWEEYLKHPESKERELTPDEFRTVFYKAFKTVCWVSLTGGEPFMRKDFVDIVMAAFSNRNIAIVSSPTNGLLREKIERDVRELMGRDIRDFFLTFSIDGPPDIHDSIRGIRGAYQRTFGTYSKVRELAKKDKRLDVRLEFTVSSMNVAYAYDYLKDILPDNKVTITIFHKGFLYKNDDSPDLSTSLYIEQVRKIVALAKSYLSYTNPMDYVERLYLDRLPDFAANPQRRIIPCLSALQRSLFMTSQGDLLPCLMWGVKLGNIRDHDLDMKSVFKGKHKIVDLIGKEQCPNCWTPCESYVSIVERLTSLRLFQ